MQSGNLNVKIVQRKLQSNTSSFQYILLAGFTPTLTHNNADHVETLSPAHTLTEDEIINVIAKLVKWTNASGYNDITNASVQKKLDKLFNPEEFTLGDIGGQSFSGLGVGNYL